MRLIGISGPARSGKDTAGQILKKLTKLECYALADPIKDTVKNLFEWNDRHSDGDLKDLDDPRFGFSPRKAYQLFGTEFGRGLSEDLWLNLAQIKAEKLGGLIVTDIRFENEATWIRKSGGVIIHIQRAACKSVLKHESENGIRIKGDDWIATNDGLANELDDRIRSILCEIEKDRKESWHDCE